MPSATVQKIEKVEPIADADKIEKAKICGWQAVVEKNQFHPQDLAVYIEIDSTVPKTPWSSFLFTGPHAEDSRVLIKTKKLRGVLSQGLVLPMGVLPEGNYSIGQDVSETLDVQHYTKPESGNGLVAHSFPAYVPKTDETMIQSCLQCLVEMAGQAVSVTVKCNGTSGTVAFKDGQLDACSRTNSYKIDAPENDGLVYIDVPKKVGFLDLLPRLGLNIAVQGEIVGPGIQKNHLGLKEKTFMVFDIWDIEAQQYWGWGETEAFCKEHKIPTVPLFKIIPNFDLTLEQLLELAQGFYEGTKNRREGIVVRLLKPKFSETLQSRLSLKVLNNVFLLKDE